MIYLFYSIIPLFFLFSIRLRDRQSQGEVIFSKNQTQLIKVFMASHIVLGHLSARGNITILTIFEKTMVFSVGMFFLFSGYGLVSSLTSNKKNFYEKTVSRFIKLLIPVCTSFLFYLFVSSVFGPYTYTDINWFVIEIIILYVLFHICFLKGITNNKIVLLTVLCVLLMLIFAIFDLPAMWYVDTLCFPLGIILKYREETVQSKLFEKRYFIIVLMILFSLSLVVGLYPKSPLVISTLFKIFAILLFCLLTSFFFNYLYIKEYSLTGKLKYITYELFLCHMPIIQMYFTSQTFLTRCLLTAISSIAIGCLLFFINVHLQKLPITARNINAF